MSLNVVTLECTPDKADVENDVSIIAFSHHTLARRYQRSPRRDDASIINDMWEALNAQFSVIRWTDGGWEIDTDAAEEFDPNDCRYPCADGYWRGRLTGNAIDPDKLPTIRIRTFIGE